jgi:hypothetical protein
MIFSALPPGCPPTDAQTCVGDVYRLIPTLPIDDRGFVSHFALYPGKTWTDGCQARGLSVSRSYEAAVKVRKRFKAYRTFKIAVASIQGGLGVIKQTGEAQHHTWWPEDGFILPSLFTIHPSEAT